MRDLDGYLVIEWAGGNRPGARLTIFDTQVTAEKAARDYQKRADSSGWAHTYSVARVESVGGRS